MRSLRNEQAELRQDVRAISGDLVSRRAVITIRHNGRRAEPDNKLIYEGLKTLIYR